MNPQTGPGWRDMEAIMGDISSEFYCAGWMGDTEFAVWRMVQEGGSWGWGKASDIPEELGALRSLAYTLGVWVYWPTDPDSSSSMPLGDGPVPIPLDEWITMYEAHRAH